MKILFLILTLLALPSYMWSQKNHSKNDTISIITPESISQSLSHLLINRYDIKASTLPIDVHRLVPGEDFSKFEDSPAMLILQLLYGQQIMLASDWDKMMFQADSLGVDENTKYLKTYFFQILADQFKVISILQRGSYYITLPFTVIVWDGKMYIMKLDDRLQEFNSIEDLDEYCFYSDELFLIRHESDEPIDSIKIQYDYKPFLPFEEKDVSIPSLNPFLNELTPSLKLPIQYNDNMFLTDQDLIEIKSLTDNSQVEDQELNAIDDITQLRTKYYNALKEPWDENLSSVINQKGAKLLIKNKLINNVYFGKTNLYNAEITYRIESNDKEYTFDCVAVLINGRWKLARISSLSEYEPKFQF